MMFNLAAFSLYDLAFIIIAGITVTAALGSSPVQEYYIQCLEPYLSLSGSSGNIFPIKF